MYRIVPPRCDSCNGLATFRSDSLGVALCYECIRTACQYLHDRQLLDSNVLAEELFAGVWDQDSELATPFEFPVWVRSPYSSTAMIRIMVQRYESQPESEDNACLPGQSVVDLVQEL